MNEENQEQPKQTVAVVEWFDERYYKITENGKTIFCPSVTTKLDIIDKPFLDRWRADVGNREAELRAQEAAQRGKRIHWAKETLLQGGAVVYNPWQNPIYTPDAIEKLKEKYGSVAVCSNQDEMVQVDKIKRQLDELKPSILAVELKVWDLEHRDAGTIDAVYQIEEGEYRVSGRTPLALKQGLYIEDLKTGSQISNEFWMQLAAYAYMFQRQTGESLAGALITHTGARTTQGIRGLQTLVKPIESLLEQEYVAYRNAAALWEFTHKDDEPTMMEFPSLITFNKED